MSMVGREGKPIRDIIIGYSTPRKTRSQQENATNTSPSTGEHVLRRVSPVSAKVIIVARALFSPLSRLPNTDGRRKSLALELCAQMRGCLGVEFSSATV
jgi:hypothetical protein